MMSTAVCSFSAKRLGIIQSKGSSTGKLTNQALLIKKRQLRQAE